MSTVEKSVEALCVGCTQILSREELSEKLKSGRPLRVKLGVDPSTPDLHLGHTVALQKLRQFQDFGHQAVLIIGDFTAMIGDPSGKNTTRPQLTHDEVLANAETYQQQAFKILDESRTELVFNGEWFGKMSFDEVIRLNSRVTLQQMMQREDFRNRYDNSQPIRFHEIQYPIMQGWDSVMIRADVELGGSDQLFNVMVGRDLQREMGQAQQTVMLLPILEGTDGVQKMSKSLGNFIGISEAPGSMFGKVMSISDELMGQYYKLLLSETLDASAHPMESKKALARRIVARFHSEAEAQRALEEFNTRFSSRNLADADLPGYAPSEATNDILSAVVEAYLQCFKQTRSKSDARRLVEQGSVQWNGEKVTNVKASFSAEEGILRLDKTRAVRVSARNA